MNGIENIIPDFVLNELQVVQTKFDINNPLRISHFLAQCKHESGSFSKTEENLNYSAVGLRSTFPKYFPDDAVANAYARQPEKIANRVYANRMGNGDEKSGDGWKYKGRGYIQLTGKDNQTKFIASCQEQILPQQIAEKKYALLSAGWFWKVNKLNEISDKGAEESVIKEVTKRVNGGYMGLSERIKYFNEIYSILSNEKVS